MSRSIFGVIRYGLAAIVSAFIPSRSLRHHIRAIYKFRSYKNNRIVIIGKNGSRKVNPFHVRGLRLNEVTGDNNLIEICKPYRIRCLEISLRHDMSIFIGSNCCIDEMIIKSYDQSTDGMISIGKNFFCNRVELSAPSKKVTISIGDDCMVSWGVSINSTDYHPIFDGTTGSRINHDESISIGNRVWICRNAILLKGAIIHDDSIVGAGAVVTKPFAQTNIVVAGNPAKIIKTNITWSRDF